MSNLSKQQIAVAVAWWADAVSSPKFDNGDPSLAGGMTAALAAMASKPVSDAQREAFKVALADVLSSRNISFVSVDYGPCQELALALMAAGIPRENAPWKTVMSFHGGGAQVKYGYGATYQDLPMDEECEANG
jgi:hypothetical protein